MLEILFVPYKCGKLSNDISVCTNTIDNIEEIESLSKQPTQTFFIYTFHENRFVENII